MVGYTDIAAHFRSQILSGELAPGQRLPTLREVTAEFGVAQQTRAGRTRRSKQRG